MSQQRVRKASAAGEAPRARSNVKAAGDSSPPNPNRHKQPRSRSKNKIPKNIRYDLDNALVGLCDVWFEDIKPHLIRNKIKVHIHGEGESPASGDHQRVPAGAHGCSHYDPGAASDRHQPQGVNYVGCYSTRPTASRAPCRKPPALAPPTSPLQLLLQSLNVQQGCKPARRQHSRPQKTNFMPPQHYHSREPLDSQTYSVYPSPHRSRYRDVRSAVPARKTRDAESQTFYSWPEVGKIVCLVCTSFQNCRKKEQENSSNNTNASTTQGSRKTDVRKIPVNQPFPVAVKVDKQTQTKCTWRRKSSTQVSSNKSARPHTPAFDRCPGKTTLLPPRLRAKTQMPSILFNESVIDDVAKANPKLIEVLFQSPNSSIFNSSITLLETPKGKRKRKNAGKKPPWR